MTDNVIRIADYERKSKSPNAARPRDPATIIILPMIRSLNAPDPESHREMEWYFP